MGIAEIAALAGAALMLILPLLGFAHERRTAPQAQVFPKLAARLLPAGPTSRPQARTALSAGPPPRDTGTGHP